jgi:hypothetical protein
MHPRRAGRAPWRLLLVPERPSGAFAVSNAPARLPSEVNSSIANRKRVRQVERLLLPALLLWVKRRNAIDAPTSSQDPPNAERIAALPMASG